MALQISYEDEFGVTHPTAYAKIAVMAADTVTRGVEVQVWVYANASSRQAGKQPVGMLHYAFRGDEYDAIFSPDAMDPEDENPIKLAYTTLKSLPYWSGSVDV